MLKTAVVEGQQKSTETVEKLAAVQRELDQRVAELRQKDIKLRQVQEENDSLQFTSQSLSKRVSSLQQTVGCMSVCVCVFVHKCACVATRTHEYSVTFCVDPRFFLRYRRVHLVVLVRTQRHPTRCLPMRCSCCSRSSSRKSNKLVCLLSRSSLLSSNNVMSRSAIAHDRA